MAGKRDAKTPWILRASADQIGLLNAAFLTTVVMAVSMWRGVDMPSFLLRAAVTFAGVYVGTVTFVFIVQRSMQSQLDAARKAERDRKRAELQAKSGD